MESDAEDEDEDTTLYFRTYVEYGKEKLESYLDMMMEETPWYYTASVLHPNIKIGWFKYKWQGYLKKRVSTVEKGVKAVMKEHAAKMAAEKGESEEVIERPAAKLRKVSSRLRPEPDTVVVDSDSDEDVFRAALRTHKPKPTIMDTQARLKNELERYETLRQMSRSKIHYLGG